MLSLEPYPEPRPDSARGALKSNLLPAPWEVLRPGVAHCEIGVWVLEGAADFSSDKNLQHTMTLLQELRVAGVLEDLVCLVNTALAPTGHGRQRRDRLPGNPIVLYLDYVDNGYTSVQRYYAKRLSREMLELADYRGREPEQSEIEARFAELEEAWEQIRRIKNTLVSLAAAKEPRLLSAGWVDAASILSGARLRHACPGVCRRSAKAVSSSDAEVIATARQREVSDVAWGTEAFERRVGRTRLPYVEVVTDAAGRGRQMRSVYRGQGGCRLLSRDIWAGFRVFDNGARWHGYSEVALGLHFVEGEQIEVEHIPADVMEYDALPDLYRATIRGAGGFPLYCSVDRLYFTRPVGEFFARRRVGLVIREKKTVGKADHVDWRSPWFDEDGVPRCRGCGGPGNQSVAGGGLQVVRGRPILRFRCFLPLSSACSGWQEIACEEEYLKLTALSQLRVEYHTMLARHPIPEATHHRDRQRSRSAANATVDRLPRVGLPAQRLRKQTTLLLNWSRLCLRNGWLPVSVSDITVNERSPVLISGRQKRSGEVTEIGVGTAGLEKLRAARRDSGANLPYGPGREHFERELNRTLRGR